jgi:hypothetical protein
MKVPSSSTLGLRRKIKISILILMGFCLSVFKAYSDDPVVTVRFANPTFTYETQTYTLDVEFQCNVASKELFGMNVRFFYDDDILEFVSFGNFVSGYGAVLPDPPLIFTGNSTSGMNLFGFSGPQEYVNGAIQKISSTPVTSMSTTGWTRLFSINFHVDDPESIDTNSFCPSAVWDLNEDASGGINPAGGLVMTLVVTYPNVTSPATEHCEQFNWVYDGIPGLPHGYPANIDCISTEAPIETPEYNTLQNVTVPSGTTTCADATQTITLAGNDTYYIVQSGANVTLIAGANILMMPGTLLESGSYTLATITTTGNYCGSFESTIVTTPPQQQDDTPLPELDRNDFKIYPNPTTGHFTLQLNEPVGETPCYFQVVGLMGNQVIGEKLTGADHFEFDLTTQNPGIYMVRLINGNHVDSGKLIKQ